MTSKHDQISADLEERIGKNFEVILRNHEYYRNGTGILRDYEPRNAVGELDRYMEKKIYKDNKLQIYSYVFETKSTDHYAARNKAKSQLYRASTRFGRCRKASKIFLYYVTPGKVELIDYIKK